MNIMHVAVVVQEEMQCSFEASRGAVRDVKHGQTCVSSPALPTCGQRCGPNVGATDGELHTFIIFH